MIIDLITLGRIDLAILFLIVILISLTFHEYGHARAAKYFGDNTAERMGRLTLNPIPHIDPMGLIMIALISIGFAKPVPTNPNNFNSPQATLWISAAGPAMNLLLTFVFINLIVATNIYHIDFLTGEHAQFFLRYMAFINILLMLFNLLPIGPLDGHYILPYFLSKNNAYRYVHWNARYGSIALLGLIGLSFLGVPVFSFLMQFASYISQFLVII